jgi:hypothetical protein
MFLLPFRLHFMLPLLLPRRKFLLVGVLGLLPGRGTRRTRKHLMTSLEIKFLPPLPLWLRRKEADPCCLHRRIILAGLSEGIIVPLLLVAGHLRRFASRRGTIASVVIRLLAMMIADATVPGSGNARIETANAPVPVPDLVTRRIARMDARRGGCQKTRLRIFA